MDLDSDHARALLTGLFDVGALLEGAPAAETTETFRAERHGAEGDLLGALLVPTSRVPEVVESLPHDGAYDPLPVELVADSGVLGVEQAKNLLLDRDELELVGVRIALPRAVDPAAFVPTVLDALTFSVPAAIELAPVPGWEAALDALAADGAERVALRVHGGDPASYAAMVAAVVDRRLPFVVADAAPLATSRDGGYGVLNLLATAGAAARGAGPDELAALLTASDVPALDDPRAIRTALHSVTVADPRAALSAVAAGPA